MKQFLDSSTIFYLNSWLMFPSSKFFFKVITHSLGTIYITYSYYQLNQEFSKIPIYSSSLYIFSSILPDLSQTIERTSVLPIIYDILPF